MTALSVALVNLKPGTGKTTSAVWLAHVFAEAGHVLLVDADPSGSALEWSDLAAASPWVPRHEAFPFRIVALPSRALHRRVPEIALPDDVVIIDTPQLEDHASIARSALRYADEILIPCAPSPIEINRTAPVRDEITEVEEFREAPARSAVLLNRCVARANSTVNAREALEGQGYEVLPTVVPRLEVYAQSFGMPIPTAGRDVWRYVARDLIERRVPIGLGPLWLPNGIGARRKWQPPWRGGLNRVRRPQGERRSGRSRSGSRLTSARSFTGSSLSGPTRRQLPSMCRGYRWRTRCGQ